MGKIKKALGLSSDIAIKMELVEKLKLQNEFNIGSKTTQEEIMQILKTKSNAEIISVLKTKTKDDKWFNETRKMMK